MKNSHYIRQFGVRAFTVRKSFLPLLNRRAPRQSIDMGHIGKAMWGTSVYLLLRIFWRPPFFLSRFGALPVCLAPRLFSLVKGS